MPIPDGTGRIHLASGDRRDEFVAVVNAVLPHVTRCVEQWASLALVATLWGVIAYLALVTFALQ